MTAQIVHAAGESVQFEIPTGTNAIVLEVANEYTLRSIARKLQLSGIAHITIQEPDPPYGGQVTAIGVVPTTDKSKLKRILGELILLGSEKSNLVCGSKPKPSAMHE